MTEGDKQRPKQIKIEMISENDLFFNYCANIDENIYLNLWEEQ